MAALLWRVFNDSQLLANASKLKVSMVSRVFAISNLVQFKILESIGAHRESI